MSRSRGVVSLVALVLNGCLTSSTAQTPLSRIQEERVVASENNDPALVSNFTLDGHLLRGHLDWSHACRRVLVPYDRSLAETTTTPSTPGAFAAAFGSIATSTTGVGLLSHINAYSDKQVCSTDTSGNQSCSSARDDATAWGVALALSGVALAATSIATLASKRTTTYGNVRLGHEHLPHVVDTSVACGSGVPANIGLSIDRASARVVASVTDENGDATFELPAWLTGSIDVVVDNVPPDDRLVHYGDIVSEFELTPP